MEPRHSDPPAVKSLVGLFASLGMTFLMVTGSAPIVNAGITRMTTGENEGQTVAAFALAFALSVFLHGPTFTTRDICLKYIDGRASLRRCSVVAFAIATFCTLCELTVALTPIGAWIFQDVFGTTPRIAAHAAEALLYFTPLSFLITWRGIYQSVHISRGRSRIVGLGTALRLAILAFLSLVVGPHIALDGAILGGVAFSIAVLTEAVFGAIAARGLPFTQRDDDGAAPTYRDLVRLSLPLWIAQYIQVSTVPLVLRMIHETQDASRNVAAFEIVKSLVWFLSSSVFACQSITIHWVHSRRHLFAVIRFAAIVSCAFSMILALLLVPAIQSWGLSSFMRVDQEALRDSVSRALPFAIVFPLLVATRSILRGLAIRSSKTLSITLATALGVLSPIVIVILGVPTSINGAILGVVTWVGVQLVESLVLLAMAMCNGMWRSFVIESD